MPKFSYRARDKQGTLVDGVVEGEEEYSVALGLRNLGYTVISVRQTIDFTYSLNKLRFGPKKVKAQELVFFMRQLATMVKTGISLPAALLSLIEQTRNPYFKITIKEVHDEVERGGSFSDSLSKHPQVFPELFISMIKVAETAGILDQVLDRLAILGMRDLELRSKIKASAIYPVILVCVGMIVIVFMLVGILPKFAALFEASNAKLPLPTVILLGISSIIRNFWWILIVIIGIAGASFKKYMSSEKGKYDFDRFLLKIPVFGDLYLKTMIARFVRTLGEMVRTGVPLLESLLAVEKTVGNVFILRIIQNIRHAIAEGQDLTDSFKASGIFPSMVVQMVNVGEKTGTIEGMFSEVANFYETEVENSLKNMVTVLEPALLMSMGLMVGFIALSVLLPIFNLIRIFKH